LEIINRNAITTWSRDGGELLEKGKFVLYDFTSDSLKTLGQNVIKINNQWCIYNGDINQDGFIDFSDLGLVDNDAYNYVSGFVVTDVNGDLFVDFSDLGLVDNNAYNYIGSVAPAFYTQTHPRVKRQLKIKD
jgi:hypothetical protein